jgi:uncharacterized protein YecE (DUF72 family)
MYSPNVKRDRSQLGLFGTDPDPNDVVAVTSPALESLAARLPERLRFGTSSWTFPGWGNGLVYGGHPTQAALVRSGLGAYAKHPLLRTVGIDRSYYAPLSRGDLSEYAAQLPPGFVAVEKAWSEVTTRVFPEHPRYGERAGKVNPKFLDPTTAIAEVIDPWIEAFGSFGGPIVFEFPPMRPAHRPSARDFAAELDRFFTALPKTARYAVELRNRELFTPRYLETLAAHGVSHVITFWSDMPTPGEQLRVPNLLTAPFVVTRLLLAPGRNYDERKAAFEPFDRLVVPQLGMRADIVELWKQCAKNDRELFVLVNNKAEGSAPLTVRAIAELIAAG